MQGGKRVRFASTEKLASMKDNNGPDGIAIDPMPVTAGEEVTILYSGLLANDGADQVFLHTGYGGAGSWGDVADLRMEMTGRGWVKTFPIRNASRLNFCFRDSANNWDNNNGRNWSVEIHDGGQY